MVIATVMLLLFNSTSEGVYSQASSAKAKAEEAAAKAKAKAKAEAAKLAAEKKAAQAAAHHHKPPTKPPVHLGKNVRNYGAVGNGKTDDAPAFKKALAAAGTGGTIYAPGGYTYALAEQIILNSQSLVGDGSTTKLYGSTFVASNPNNSSSNAMIVMNGSGGSVNKVALNCIAPPANAGGMTAFAVASAKNVTISNCQMGPNFYNAVVLLASQTVHVTSNAFTGDNLATSDNVYIISGSNYTVSQNTFVNVNSAVTVASVTNAVFDNNQIQNGNNGTYADFYFIGSGPVTNVEIAGNTMEMLPGSTALANQLCLQAIVANQLSSAVPISGINISNNTIDGGCSFAAVAVQGATGVTINNNKFQNINTNCSNSSTVPGLGAISVGNCGATINGNKFTNVDSCAIAAETLSAAAALQIENNTASNCFIYSKYNAFPRSPAFNVAVINVLPDPIAPANKYQSIVIKDNTYTGGGNPWYFIECKQAGAQESGNTAPPQFPSYYAN